jgi:hypothetical protein
MAEQPLVKLLEMTTVAHLGTFHALEEERICEHSLRSRLVCCFLILSMTLLLQILSALFLERT